MARVVLGLLAAFLLLAVIAPGYSPPPPEPPKITVTDASGQNVVKSDDNDLRLYRLIYFMPVVSSVVAAALVFWLVIYSFMNAPVRYVVLYPLGLAMLLYIAIGAVARGRRVEWKERQYDSA